MESGQPFQAIGEHLRGGPQRTALLLGALGHLVQLRRHQPGIEHAVTGLAHQGGDVDAHGADHGTAPAHGAGVVEQLLPLLQLVHGHLAREPQPAADETEWAHLALVGALERLQLVDRRVLGVAGLAIEMAGLGALPAADAGVEVGGGDGADILNEVGHGAVDALRVGQLALLVVTGRARLGTVRRGIGGGLTHTSVPLCAACAPRKPRENRKVKVCMSLPNGSQMNSSSTVSKCRASTFS